MPNKLNICNKSTTKSVSVLLLSIDGTQIHLNKDLKPGEIVSATVKGGAKMLTLIDKNLSHSSDARDTKHEAWWHGIIPTYSDDINIDPENKIVKNGEEIIKNTVSSSTGSTSKFQFTTIQLLLIFIGVFLLILAIWYFYKKKAY